MAMKRSVEGEEGREYISRTLPLARSGISRLVVVSAIFRRPLFRDRLPI